MPVSKRDKKVSLTKTIKKGMMLKTQVIENIRKSVDDYNTLFVFNTCNMRQGPMTTIREEWKGSRFFLAKKKVMAVALGRTKEEEILKNLHKVAGYMAGDCGLLFTNKPKNEVIRWFENYSTMTYAKAGFEVAETVRLPAGPMLGFTFAIEPHLRSLGMPTQLEKGVIVLREDFTVCTAGSKLTPEQAQILKLIEKPITEFKLQLVCLWSKDGSFEKFKAAKEAKIARFKAAPADRKLSNKTVFTSKDITENTPEKHKNIKKEVIKEEEDEEEGEEEDEEEEQEEEEELAMQVEELLAQHKSPGKRKQSLENKKLDTSIKSQNYSPRQQGTTPKNTPAKENKTPKKQTPTILQEPDCPSEEEIYQNKSPAKQFIKEERKTPKQLNRSLKSQNNTPKSQNNTPKSQNNTPKSQNNTPKQTPKRENQTPKHTPRMLEGPDCLQEEKMEIEEELHENKSTPKQFIKEEIKTPKQLNKSPKSQNNTPKQQSKTPKTTPAKVNKTPLQTPSMLEIEEATEQKSDENVLTKPSPKLGKGNLRRSMRTPKPLKRTPEQRRQSVKKLTESAKMTPKQTKATPKLTKDTPKLTKDTPKRQSIRKSKRFAESVDVEMAE